MYEVNDSVSHGGTSYIATAQSTGQEPPDADYWGVLASVGAQGIQGSTGDQGPTGPQGIQGVAGAQGATGPQGAQGPVGAQGAVGPTGAQGVKGDAGVAGLLWRGAWSAETSYSTVDGVTHNGSSYIALANNVGSEPPSASWQILALKGDQGPQGSQGIAGATGATGPQGIQGISGEQGVQGPQGIQGTQGPQGATGPQGQKGSTGDPGPTVNWTGPWSAATTYAARDAVSHNGSSYMSLKAHSNSAPPSADWVLLAQNGAVGATGATGPKAVTWQGAWVDSANYVIDDVATHGGSAYIAVASSNGSEPPSAHWCLMVAKGDTGPSGPSGPSGPPGEGSAEGSIGATGPTGPAGPTGATGLTGEAGPAGATGPAGAAGPAGEAGSAGPTGATGPAGVIGATGPAGATGPTGIQGTAGPSGPSGTTGATGPSGPAGSATITLQNTNGGAVVKGTPVYMLGAGTFAPGDADAVATADIIGLVADASIGTSASGSIMANGVLEATTAQWDAVTGDSGGLTVGAVYYLSATIGMLTKTAPTTVGWVVAQIGIALSTTKLLINIQTPVQL